MAIYEFEGKHPLIGSDTYIHSNATIIGQVEIGSKCYIGPGAVIRADYGKICIGSGCAVEDNCIIHTEPESIVIIEDEVIIGHGAIIHGPCLIKANVIIGMGSIVSTGCEINSLGFLGAGSILPPGKHIPAKTLALGNPARNIKPVEGKNLEYCYKAPAVYRDLVSRYINDIKLSQE